MYKQKLFKKNILNIIGITLSLFLSFAVWYSVMFFIKSNENKIIDSKNTNNLITPEIGIAIGYNDEYTESQYTSQMISTILTYWINEPMSIHDVKTGQISLENAIKVADDCIDYLTTSGILLNTTEEYSYSFALYGPIDSDDLDNVESYSYWNAVYINSYYTISFHINAVSGDIWYTKITSTEKNMDFININPEDALFIYEAYLNLSSHGSLFITPLSAYKVYNSLYVLNVAIDENQILLQLLPY